jgi:hypothetical protein
MTTACTIGSEAERERDWEAFIIRLALMSATKGNQQPARTANSSLGVEEKKLNYVASGVRPNWTLRHCSDVPVPVVDPLRSLMPYCHEPLRALRATNHIQ